MVIVCVWEKTMLRWKTKTDRNNKADVQEERKNTKIQNTHWTLYRIGIRREKKRERERKKKKSWERVRKKDRQDWEINQ